MAENKKFTKLINSDGTKQAVALDKVSFDAQTKKLTLYSSVDNSIKEETTIPASEVDTTLSKSGQAADAKTTGDAVKDVVKVGGTASSFTGIIVGTQEEEVELVEQAEFDELKERVDAIDEKVIELKNDIIIISKRDDSWSAVRENVKMGLGKVLYPVGTIFEVKCPTGAPYSSIKFVVIGHDHDTLVDAPSDHTMTVCMVDTIYGTPLDAQQAIIVPSDTMVAGTYNFHLLNGYDTAYDGGKFAQFTLTNDVLANDQLVMTWNYNQTWIGKNLTVYSPFSTTAKETCVMEEGQGGTYLGDTDGSVAILNHIHRGRYGSNNYAESAARQWLNSDGLANAWQTQQTKFQRPCSYANRAGFLTYLDPEFVNIVGTSVHKNRTNTVFDLNGKTKAYETQDKFFMLSNEEVGFATESGIVTGSVYDYYKDAEDIDRIKYDITNNATARSWWLRAPSPSSAISERIVNTTGVLNGYSAYIGYGATAACVI